MAMLRLVCYQCAAVMPADQRKASKRARCPKCDAPLRIPPLKYFQQYDGKRVKCLREPEWLMPDGLPMTPPAPKPEVGQIGDDSLEGEFVEFHGAGGPAEVVPHERQTTVHPSETASAPPPAPAPAPAPPVPSTGGPDAEEEDFVFESAGEFQPAGGHDFDTMMSDDDAPLDLDFLDEDQ